MRRRAALEALGAASRQLRKAQNVHHGAVRAAVEAGASVDEIAAESGLSREVVAHIVSEDVPVTAYFVTVERHGVAPLTRRVLVHGTSDATAAELATWVAERSSGGLFEAVEVRRAGEREVGQSGDAYDDADIWTAPSPPAEPE